MEYHYDFSGFKILTFERLLKDCIDPQSIWIFFEDIKFDINSRVGFIEDLTMECDKRYLDSKKEMLAGHYELLRRDLYHFANTQGFSFSLSSFYFDDLLYLYIKKIDFPDIFYDEDFEKHFDDFLAFLSPYFENIKTDKFYESLDIADVNLSPLLEGVTP